jgi:hypothetical protein
MEQQKSNKELAREYMKQRETAHKAPPDINTVRRQLGWGLSNPATTRKGSASGF